MALEVEAKLRVASHEPVRARLGDLGATLHETALETNRLFDDDRQFLLRTDRGLRVRTTRTPEGRVLRSTLTCKGPQQGGQFKRREENETDVSNPEAAIAILAALGFHQVLCFEKRRETWLFEALTATGHTQVRVELDELPDLGCFVEIEGSPDAIDAARAALGLSDQPLLVETYVAMAATYCDSIGRRPAVLTFA